MSRNEIENLIWITIARGRRLWVSLTIVDLTTPIEALIASQRSFDTISKLIHCDIGNILTCGKAAQVFDFNTITHWWLRWHTVSLVVGRVWPQTWIGTFASVFV